MSFHTDLLQHTLQLVARDDGEAALRRATSTAYYALFHLLVATAVERIGPSIPASVRHQIRRVFSHGDMVAVCRQFSAGDIRGLHPATRKLMTEPIEPDLANVALGFRILQEARIQADYDLGFQVSRDWATERVARAELAFAQCEAVKDTPNATVFLAALAFQRSWSRSA